jgi:hypothetical protein
MRRTTILVLTIGVAILLLVGMGLPCSSYESN